MAGAERRLTGKRLGGLDDRGGIFSEIFWGRMVRTVLSKTGNVDRHEIRRIALQYLKDRAQ